MFAHTQQTSDLRTDKGEAQREGVGFPDEDCSADGVGVGADVTVGWVAAGRLHLDPLLLAELRQRLFDAERSQARGAVGVPALPHDLGHHP